MTSRLFILLLISTLIFGQPVEIVYDYYDGFSNECDVVVCLGDASECYLNSTDHAVCLCEKGRYGDRCEFTECNPSTCLGARSKCEDTVDRGPVCSCEEGRNGKKCEIITNHTSSDPSHMIAPTNTPPSSSTTAVPLIILGCLLLVFFIALVVTQVRRSPKKRLRTEECKKTVLIPTHVLTNQSIIPMISSSPMAKRRRDEPVFTDNYLHRLASGDGLIRIENQSNDWMINARNANGRTPLHCLAAASYQKKTPAQVQRDAKTLIDNGADINARDNDGNTPLHLALIHVRLSLVKILLAQKNIDCCVMNNDEKTPLHIAAELDDSLAMDFIMAIDNAKYSLNMTTKLNYTPLVVNLMSNPPDTNFARKLLTYGADPNYVGDKTFVSDSHLERTALHYAAMFGMLEHIQLLIDNGANVNATDQRKRTALHFAVESRSLKIVKLLVSLGANMYLDNDQGEAPVDIAKRLEFNEAIEFFNSDEAKNTEIGGRKRRIRKKSSIDKAKKKKRESIDTGYQSSCHLEEEEEEEEDMNEIDETPMRNLSEGRIRSRIFDDNEDPLSTDMEDYQYMIQSTMSHSTVSQSYHIHPPPPPQLSLPPTPQFTPAFQVIQKHQNGYNRNSPANGFNDQSILREFFEMV